MASTPNSILRLRKHADYQRVYASSKKQFAKQMSYFYALRPAERRSDTTGPRIGLTVGKVMGKAVERNRIKRRMRECIRRNEGLIHAPVDVILHPRRVVIELEFAKLEREVAQVFRSIQMALDKHAALDKQASGIQAANKQTNQPAAEDVAGQ
jgi:ribonuclease P protein component